MPAVVREFLPESLPEFPGGLDTVELQTVSLAKLDAGDLTEQDRLFEICKQQGFFYLDFSNTSNASLPSQSEDVARLAEDIFKLPQEEKLRFKTDIQAKSLFGYKGPGVGVVDNKGTGATSEFYGISKNHVIDPSNSAPYPELVKANKPLVESYMTGAHDSGLRIMSHLAQKLNMPADTFDHLHRFSEVSGDHIRLTRGPPRKDPRLPEIQTGGHTDFGTITILFNWLGGLQIWSESARGMGGFTNVVDPESTNAKWLWVKPKPGMAVVNLGDAAVKFTNGLFCSGRHRVVPAPGVQGTLPRYSVVYFVRPEDAATLKTLKSDGIKQPEQEEEINAKDWIAQQAAQMLGLAAKPKVPASA